MSKYSEKSFDIQINFLADKPFILKKGLIYINLNSENLWELIDNESIASYPNTIIKIVDLVNDETWFMFLTNASIFVDEDKIEINTFSKFNRYVTMDVKKPKSAEILKAVTKEIEYFGAKQNFGLDFNQFAWLNKLKKEQYAQKMIVLLKLQKAEREWR
ncbi:hypothetical protein OF364_01645 [Mycoplasma enhydrae]|uniref:MSC_0621 family F1-like ATPase epsilon subunit n=1 Tax=Mycoplasma enhydrae TaxID=2499220 RepID=UPI00197BB47B|nr:hypothetical protein [Mycoplasma enhydrae]MBN4089645.1 hypothetical protein [Mycoplasma enhydrae]MCV3733761.1 hypothetical protein [Mycoplasma enhydrae]MCV3753516.1 hypothetical protein [Mycoplasma enhydrae]